MEETERWWARKKEGCCKEERRLNRAFKVVGSKVSLGVIKSWSMPWPVVSVCWGWQRSTPSLP